MRGALVIAIVVLLAGGAAAQDSTSSIGGNNWDSPSSSGYDYSSSSSGYDYSSSSSGYDYSSSSYDSSSSSSGSSSGRSLTGTELLIVGMFVVAWCVIMVLRQSGQGLFGGGRAVPYGVYVGDVDTPSVDVTLLRFGLDARTRPFVQSELDRIARSADTRTPEGLATTLREIALLLRRVRDGWVYGGAHNFPMSAKQTARGSFQQHVDATRALSKRELVRNANGVITTGERGEYPRRSYEGPGLVLVTIVVAARRELFTVTKIGDGDELRRALEVLSALDAQTLMAMEVVWTPSDPEDRMSSMELEALLPGDIFPIQGAMVGKVVCTYCGGPFPKELLSCPHCGGKINAAA